MHGSSEDDQRRQFVMDALVSSNLLAALSQVVL